jgi:hypothetical protein
MARGRFGLFPFFEVSGEKPEPSARAIVKGASPKYGSAADMLHFAAFYFSESECWAAFA